MVTIAAAVLLLTAAASTAGAAPLVGPAQVNTFVGTSGVAAPAPGCAFILQTFDATYGSSRHPGALHLRGCIDIVDPVSSYAFTGTFIIDAPDGRQIRGSASGVVALGSSYTGCPVGQAPRRCPSCSRPPSEPAGSPAPPGRST